MVVERQPATLFETLPEEGPSPPLIFIQGPDDYTRESLISRIVKKYLSGPQALTFGLEEMEAPEVDPVELLGSLRTIPMGQPLKIVVLRRFERASASVVKEEKKGKETASKREGRSPLDSVLSKYLAHPSRKTLLVVSSAAVLKKNSRFYRSLPDTAILVSCPGFRGREANRFVKAILARHGKKASEGWIDQLVEIVGPDARRLASELEKILLLVGMRETLAPGDLEIVSSAEMPRDVFALLNAIGSGRPDHAVEIMREILRTAEPPLRILSVLLWHYRLVLKAKHLANLRDPRELRKIHASRFVAQKVARQSRDLSLDSVKKVFAVLRETDRLLKGSRLPASHLMESLVFTLASCHKTALRADNS